MTHPSSLDLEALVVGEPLPERLREHVDACSECSAFVEGLRALVADAPSRSAELADAAVALALGANEASPAPPGTAARGRAARREAPGRRLWVVASSVVVPFAAAAAILLFVSSPSRPRVPTAPASSVTAEATPTDRILMGTIPGVAEPDTQFKGGMQVAVVRERAGQQTRFSGTTPVKAGDRIRIEVALDHPQAILAGVLADDGSYLEMMPAAVRGPGTHFSERSARIDASGGRPTRGTILVGTPEAVAHARATRQLDGVTTLRIESQSESGEP